MNYSNQVDILYFLNNENAIVIRKSEDFPNYYTYSDIDIITLSPDKLIMNLWNKFNKKYRGLGFHMDQVKTTKHCHIDIYPPKASRLDLRFDVINSFEEFYSFGMDKKFFGDVFLRAKDIVINNRGSVRVPDSDDETIIRYFEYLKNPHKKKHQKYVVEHCTPGFIKRLDEMGVKHGTI